MEIKMALRTVLRDGIEMADAVTIIEVASVELDVPVFNTMSDARACVCLLHTQFGIQLYAREYTLAGTTVYVVY